MQELRQEYSLKGLLAISGLARSSFYYQFKLLRLTDKYVSLKVRIRSIFAQHRGRYGYRRVTAAIRREGVLVNRKTVQRLMGALGLKSCVRIKKYHTAARWVAPHRTSLNGSSEQRVRTRSG